MTCKELRSQLEDHDLGRHIVDSVAVAEHASGCAECSQFLDEQRELEASLRLLRESTPVISHSADSAILEAYRQHAVANASFRQQPVPRRVTVKGAFAWAGALALAIVVAGAVLTFFSPAHETASPPVQLQNEAASQSAKSPEAPVQDKDRSRVAPTVATNAVKHKVRIQRVEATPTAAEVVNVPDPLPGGFRSLMFCDPVSCGGPMQMIRVELPPSAAGLASNATASSETVYAEVLVGSDGLAPGIRVLK